MNAEPSTVVRVPRGLSSRDHGWFDELYPHLHRVACVAAPADIDPADLVQDALVKYLQLAEPGHVRSPRAFLTTTVVNLASNHRRSWSRQRTAMGRLGRPVDAHNDFPSDLGYLEQLPPRERAVLYLHYIDGFAFDDVGALLGCTGAAARKTAERGRRRLGALIQGDDQ